MLPQKVYKVRDLVTTKQREAHHNGRSVVHEISSELVELMCDTVHASGLLEGHAMYKMRLTLPNWTVSRPDSCVLPRRSCNILALPADEISLGLIASHQLLILTPLALHLLALQLLARQLDQSLLLRAGRQRRTCVRRQSGGE